MRKNEKEKKDGMAFQQWRELRELKDLKSDAVSANNSHVLLHTREDIYVFVMILSLHVLFWFDMQQGM